MYWNGIGSHGAERLQRERDERDGIRESDGGADRRVVGL